MIHTIIIKLTYVEFNRETVILLCLCDIVALHHVTKNILLESLYKRLSSNAPILYFYQIFADTVSVFNSRHYEFRRHFLADAQLICKVAGIIY